MKPTVNYKKLLTNVFFICSLIISSHVLALESGDIEQGKAAFGNCAGCHQIGEGAGNGFGPSLTGVVGRDGKFPGYSYSPSLEKAKDKGLVWTPDLVFEWLAGPSDFLKKYLKDDKAESKMPVNFPDEKLRKDVVAYLSSMSEKKK